jgi:SAM-dependent methyltransferase
VSEWLVEELVPRPGDTVLELAAGPGETGFGAAALIGEQGRLISTDFSPGMVEVARCHGAEIGLQNVDYRVMDAEHIELDPNSVDGVLCRFGLMLMANPGMVLAEVRRVLRRGGRLALSVWGAVERNPWAGIGAGLLIQQGHMPAPEPGAPGPFSMGDQERLRELLEGTGFAPVHIEEVSVCFRFRSTNEFVSWASDTAGPFAKVILALSDGERDVLEAELRKAFRSFEAHGNYQLPGVSLCAVAS